MRTTLASLLGAAVLLLGAAPTWAAPAEVSPQSFTLNSSKFEDVSIALPTRARPLAEVCFQFKFARADLTYHEEVKLEIGHSPQASVGFFNPNTTPQLNRTLCITAQYQPELLKRFNDGRQVVRISATGFLEVKNLAVKTAYQR